MYTIFKYEIKSFLGSSIGYLVMTIFILLHGLFLWVFDSDFNIFNQGFADLNTFFNLAPWIFIFLIPAITMKSFAEEKKIGTLELLCIKPIATSELVLGKFFGILVLLLFALLFTTTYVFTVYQLGNPVGNIDLGSTLGAYLGLLGLVATYSAIGIFCSTLSANQIICFLWGVIIIFLFYYGFNGLGSLFSNIEAEINALGMYSHFQSIQKGVLDIKDLVYFISVTLFFLVWATTNLKKTKG